jgi:WD40 repeat protein
MNNIIEKLYKKQAILEGHTYPMSCMTLNENKLYSGSRFMDNTIRIWNTETYEEIDTLRGNISYVNCLTNDKKKQGVPCDCFPLSTRISPIPIFY